MKSRSADDSPPALTATTVNEFGPGSRHDFAILLELVRGIDCRDEFSTLNFSTTSRQR